MSVETTSKLFSNECSLIAFDILQIPLHSSMDTRFRSLPIHLSHIDEYSLCTTLTVNKDQFRNFSFMAF